MEARRPAKPLRSKRRVTEVALGAHANAAFERDWLAVSRASSSESPRFAGQPPLQHQRATSSCEITPFSLHVLRLASLARCSLSHRNTGLPGFWDALSARDFNRKRHPLLRLDSGFRPKQKPRLAMEPGPKAQRMQLMLSANSSSAMAVRALPYPRLRTRL